jgi:hypothetical protein
MSLMLRKLHTCTCIYSSVRIPTAAGSKIRQSPKVSCKEESKTRAGGATCQQRLPMISAFNFGESLRNASIMEQWLGVTL